MEMQQAAYQHTPRRSGIVVPALRLDLRGAGGRAAGWLQFTPCCWFIYLKRLSVRKDKKKVVGEPMTDEQIAVFLGFRPQGDEPVDHYILARAYRSLRAHDFMRFLEMFQAAGHDVNAVDVRGRTVLQLISEHEQADEYVAALLAAGAHPVEE